MRCGHREIDCSFAGISTKYPSFGVDTRIGIWIHQGIRVSSEEKIDIHE